jgi:hypothetical protein
MKVLLMGLLGVFVLAGMLVFVLGCFGPDLKKYEHLKDPQISTAPRQRMITVHIKGDPNVTAGSAAGVLYKNYYKVTKTFGPPPALRARWPKNFDTPKEEFIGIYGLPIPENVESLPEQDKGTNLNLKIEYWEYGQVAEILHVGPYSEETPTIERLKKFIDDSGYKIVGAHEEEYLKGPGMSGKGNPAEYWTIIRYQIEEK